MQVCRPVHRAPEQPRGADATIEIRVPGGMCPQGTFCGWLARAAESVGSWQLVDGDEESTGAVEPAAVQEVVDAAFWETASCHHAWSPGLVEEFLAMWDRAGIPRLDPVPNP